jgi:hypothetical protein
MQHTIRLTNKNDTQEDIKFITRTDLKKDFYKEKLLHFYKKKNSIRCLCDERKELYLYVKENGVVAIYPKSEEHKDDCVFYSKRKEFIDNETGEYKSSIFKDVESKVQVKSKNESDKEKCQRLTYYDFCRDAIASAALEAFNYDYGKYNKVYNISFQQFCFSYLNVLNKTKLYGKDMVLEFFKKNKDYCLEYGILTDDIKDINVDNDENLTNLSLNKIYYDKTDKRWKTYTKEASTTCKRLRLSKQLIQIWNNFIEPPYFYTAVYYKDIIIRFHLMPIFINDKNIVFVESNFERNYAKKLIDENTVFIKPISNDEVYKIDPKIINSKCKYIPEIKFHPDFLEFSNNKMIITEVSGFVDKDYKNHLEKKMRYYLKYIKNCEFLYDYKCIDGNSLEIVDYKFNSNYWDGEGLVEKGLFQGKKWNQIYNDTLNWYVKNTDGYFKECAIKELKRRDGND